jgi:hypothetical protein
VTVRTWRRLCRALEEATAADDGVAGALAGAWRRLEAAEAQAGYPIEQTLRATRTPPGALWPPEPGTARGEDARTRAVP